MVRYGDVDAVQGRLRRNLRLLYAMRIVGPFLLLMPVLVPFLQQNGLDQTRVYLLDSVYALTIVALEIPSAYFSDRVSRRYCLLLGSLFSLSGYAVYSLAHGFGTFVIGQVFVGAGFAFISGADSALAYDTLASLGSVGPYQRFEGRSTAYGGFSEAAASLIGGALVVVSLRTPVIAQVGVYLLLVPLSLMLYEPARIRRTGRNPFRDALWITRYALHGHQEVRWLILYGAVASTLTRTMVVLTQPYYQLVGVPLVWFGALWAVQLLALGIFSFLAQRYEQWLGVRRALASVMVIGVASYLVLGAAPSLLALTAILGLYFVRGVHLPILLNYMNRLVDSDVRNTILSVKSLIQSLMYAGLGPLLGLIVDTFSLRAALLVSAVLYGLCGVVVVHNLRQVANGPPSPLVGSRRSPEEVP